MCIRDRYEDIFELFSNAGIENFEKLPSYISVCRKFAKDFKAVSYTHLDVYKRQLLLIAI